MILTTSFYRIAVRISFCESGRATVELTRRSWRIRARSNSINRFSPLFDPFCPRCVSTVVRISLSSPPRVVPAKKIHPNKGNHRRRNLLTSSRHCKILTLCAAHLVTRCLTRTNRLRIDSIPRIITSLCVISQLALSTRAQS